MLPKIINESTLTSLLVGPVGKTRLSSYSGTLPLSQPVQLPAVEILAQIGGFRVIARGQLVHDICGVRRVGDLHQLATPEQQSLSSRVGRAILEKVGCPHLLTTLGSDGMALFSGPSEVWHVPTMAQDVFDVTGAGDTVIATLGLGLAAGLPLLASCVLANYAAGLVVAQVGAAVASPDALREAIRELPVTITKW